jgi:large conductance mechanosensitive channel
VHNSDIAKKIILQKIANNFTSGIIIFTIAFYSVTPLNPFTMSMIKEFKEFAIRGNVIDLAVAVIIGGAFGKIISALVDNIMMPLIGILMEGKNFTTLSLKVGEAEVKYGLFLQNVVDFILIAFVLFLVIKGINNFKKAEAPAPPPGPTNEEKLLMEIRDALKK